MPDSEPETPLGLLVRQHRLTLSVSEMSATQRYTDPDLGPLRGRVMNVAGVKYQVFGADPFVLFDKIAAWVMANYQPREEQPVPDALGEVPVNTTSTRSWSYEAPSVSILSNALTEALHRQRIVLENELGATLDGQPIVTQSTGVWTA